MNKKLTKECELCGKPMQVRVSQFKQKKLCNICANTTKKDKILDKYYSKNKKSRRALYFKNKVSFNIKTRKGVEI